MPHKDPVIRKEYYKKWKEANREKTKINNQRYRDKNKEAINARTRKWRKENAEANHKSFTLSNWKKIGLIVDDEDEYESIYYLVMSTEECENCGCILTGNKPQTSTSRCMDHCHITGKFRNVLCCSCNSKLPKQKKKNIIIDNENITKS